VASGGHAGDRLLPGVHTLCGGIAEAAERLDELLS